MLSLHLPDREARERIIRRIETALAGRADVVFGVVFGSFLDREQFRDIDGHPLAVRDERFLADLMERIARDYHDRAPLLRRAAAEAFAR